MIKSIDTWLVNKFLSIVSVDSVVYRYLYEVWEKDVPDQRVKDYFLVDISFLSSIAIQVLYLLTIYSIIPSFMKNRKPFEMKLFILLYNMFMVVMNGYFFVKVLFDITNFGLELWNFSNPKNDVSDKAMAFIDTAHLYYLSKIVDYLDTIIMCLKKNRRQITFLHVWHHVTMVWAGWAFMRYNPYMPTCAIIPITNGFIHVLMYSYYALSSLGPQYRKYLWWKKYLTHIQIFQFYIHIPWYTTVYFKQTDLPWGYVWANIANGTMFLVLFLNYFYQSYKKANKNNEQTKKQA